MSTKFSSPASTSNITAEAVSVDAFVPSQTDNAEGGRFLRKGALILLRGTKDAAEVGAVDKVSQLGRVVAVVLLHVAEQGAYLA